MTLELRGSARPTLQQALRWIGSRVDDIYGASIGKLEDIWMDPDSGEPLWLLVRDGRIGGRHTLVPFAQAASGAGHVWIPFEREVVRGAPAVRPSAPLSHELSDTLRRYYAESGHPVAAARGRSEDALRASPVAGSHAEAPRTATRTEAPRVTAQAQSATGPSTPRRPAPPPEAPAPRHPERRPGSRPAPGHSPSSEPPPLPPMPHSAPRRPPHQPVPEEGFARPRPQEPWARGAEAPAPPPRREPPRPEHVTAQQAAPPPPPAPAQPSAGDTLRLAVGDTVDMELVGRLQFRGSIVRMDPVRPDPDARG